MSCHSLVWALIQKKIYILWCLTAFHHLYSVSQPLFLLLLLLHKRAKSIIGRDHHTHTQSRTADIYSTTLLAHLLAPTLFTRHVHINASTTDQLIHCLRLINHSESSKNLAPLTTEVEHCPEKNIVGILRKLLKQFIIFFHDKIIFQKLLTCAALCTMC